MDNQTHIWAAQTTTDAAADLGAAWDKRNSKSTVIVFRNTGANGATYQLQGSVDGTTFVNIGTTANVASGATATITVTDYWPHLKLRVNAQVGGAQTTVSAAGAACGSA